MCSQREARDKLICEAQSRIKWRRSCMTAIRKRLDKMETESELKEIFSSTISKWSETAAVDRAKYQVKYQKTIRSQRRIRCLQENYNKNGYIYKTYLQEESTNTTTGRKQDSYIWGASIVQILLSQYIVLWEPRNKEVHRKTKEHQERTRKERLKIEASQLNSMKDITRPSDMFLFHANEEDTLSSQHHEQ